MFTLSPRGTSSASTVGPSFSEGTLARKRGFLYLYIGIRDDANVRGYDGAVLQIDDVAGDEFARRHHAFLPSRSTRAVGALMLFSASSALAAFFSCTMPTAALSATTASMITASAHSPMTMENTPPRAG